MELDGENICGRLTVVRDGVEEDMKSFGLVGNDVLARNKWRRKIKEAAS